MSLVQSNLIRTSESPRPKVDYLIDLRSDTVTRPGLEMRQRMAKAEVGDDIMREDYTAQELERRTAELFGKDAGLFVPTGTMGNLLAFLVHCNGRGSEAIVGDQAHMFKFEQGGMAQFGGIIANKIPNLNDGTFSIDLLKENIRKVDDDHFTITSLICLENTHNLFGGRILPLEWIDEVTKIARSYNIPVHMDGARILNATVTTGIPVDRIVRDCDSVTICFSKNLGAPCGSVLVGSKEFINKSRRLRKALGGGMYQIGILAAACIYSLDKMVDRLIDDHKNARVIMEAINAINSPIFWVDPEQVETNIVLLKVRNIRAEDVRKRLEETPEHEVAALGASISILCFCLRDTTIRCSVGAHSCAVTANYLIFGDTFPGVYKFLSVKYECASIVDTQYKCPFT